MIRLVMICCCGWLLAACAAKPWQTPSNLVQSTEQADPFRLSLWQSATAAPDRQILTLIIEGDGRAFTRSGRISPDPTPHKPLAPQLVEHIPGAIAIARPCQFTEETGTPCRDKKYWSSHRWSAEVIDAYDRLIDRLKQRYHARHIELIGFSGGAAIAVLVAARRDDVSGITTLAGNLDTDGVNAWHKVTATPQSLNPIHVAKQIAHIPQRHMIGTDDRIIPDSIARNFIRAQGQPHCAGLHRLPIGHDATAWVKSWNDIKRIGYPCQAATGRNSIKGF